MKALLVHHNVLADGYVPMGISVLSSVLKKQGHEVDVFDTFYYKHNDRITDVSPLFKSVHDHSSRKDVYEAYQERLENFDPDLIGFSATENEVPMIKELANRTSDHPYKVLGGAYSTTMPEEAIKIKSLEAICVGEGEEALSELMDALENKKPIENIKNLWIKKSGRVHKNPTRKLIDMNKLPFMDYDFCEPELLSKPFMGKEYITGQIEMTRGCHFACSYCINSYLHELSEDSSNFLRKKEPKRIIDELEFLKEKHNLEFLRFGDENFLWQPSESLEEFARLYKERINLPFIMATRPETITEKTIEILKTIPCKQVSMGIEHGNEKFRKDVLKRTCTDKSITRGFGLLRKAGIRSGAYTMIGFPTETEELIQDTFNLTLKTNPDIAAVYFFRPYPKTPLMDMCIEKDLLIEGLEPNYFEGSMVKGIPFERLKQLRDDFYKRFKEGSPQIIK